MTPKAAELLAIATEIVALEDRLAMRLREFREVAASIGAGRATPRSVVEQKGEVASPPPNPLSIRGRILGCFRGPGDELVAGDIVRAVQRAEGRVRVKPEVVHTTLSKLAADGVLVRVRFGVYRLAGGRWEQGSERRAERGCRR